MLSCNERIAGHARARIDVQSLPAHGRLHCSAASGSAVLSKASRVSCWFGMGTIFAASEVANATNLSFRALTVPRLGKAGSTQKTEELKSFEGANPRAGRTWSAKEEMPGIRRVFLTDLG